LDKTGSAVVLGGARARTRTVAPQYTPPTVLEHLPKPLFSSSPRLFSVGTVGKKSSDYRPSHFVQETRGCIPPSV